MRNKMKRALFIERFEIRKDNLPGGWMIEKNSDLEIPALTYENKTISLLSAGNKYIPIIPDISNFLINCIFEINYSIAGCFGFLLSYHYDIETRCGSAVFISSAAKSNTLDIEFGSVCCNIFTPESPKTSFPLKPASFCAPFEFSLEVKNRMLELKIADITLSRKRKASSASGKLAISRKHFFDVLKIKKCEIFSNDSVNVLNEVKFSITLPEERTFYPILCDVTLRDYGNCMDADMVFSGGVADSEVGEGNYSAMKYDMLENMYLKIIEETENAKYYFHEGELVLVNKELTPSYFWGVLHKKTDWPYKRSVRFIKPSGKFDLAIGADFYMHSTFPLGPLEPAEIVFNETGKVLYSGLGISDGIIKTEFLSQQDKLMAEHLPKKNPRAALALDFVKNNHYFIEGEKIMFTIKLISSSEIPVVFDVQIENAYFTPLAKLKYKKETLRSVIGVKTYNVVMLKFPAPSIALKPGVYHLRVRSLDKTVVLEEYCAFEIISSNKNSPPPPIISGLPYIYDSRSETRGLITDAFDPWNGKSVDIGHYISCANFLPATARKFDVIPTIHAYRREYFLWLGPRCCDKYLVKDNKDLIKHADYVNASEELERYSLQYVDMYSTGWRLEKFYEMAKSLNDPEFDLKKIENLIEAAKSKKDVSTVSKSDKLNACDIAVMTRNHWEEWLDYINTEFEKRAEKFMAGLRKINPGIKFADYGPAHIYASHLKGPEFPRYLMNGKISTDLQGFWQYEDYPFACAYGIERGTYFLTSCLLALPGHRIYPEIYTTGDRRISGCPDGAVFYAHPPYGYAARNPLAPIRMTRSVYEFALATAHLTSDGFHYWDKPGFQACKFSRAWFEALLNGWRTVHDYPPERPLRSAAFVSSEESRRAAEAIICDAYCSAAPLDKSCHINVRKTATEDVPYAYQVIRTHGFNAGFQLLMENIDKLKPQFVDVLVLPPLAGVSERYLNKIRKLHEKGVSLLAFEDVSGLEDIFGVRRTPEKIAVTKLSAAKGFMDEPPEYCFNKLCAGKYKSAGAKVLVNAEIPVLMLMNNKNAKAAFFNVPPMCVREDELHERLGFGKDGISKFIDKALAKVMESLVKPEITVSEGRLIAYHSKNGHDVVIVTNPDETRKTLPVLHVLKGKGRLKFLSCDRDYTILSENSKEFVIRTILGPGETAVALFQ